MAGLEEEVEVEFGFGFFFAFVSFSTSSRFFEPRREVQGRAARRRLPALARGAVEVGLLRARRGREARAGVQGSAEALNEN